MVNASKRMVPPTAGQPSAEQFAVSANFFPPPADVDPAVLYYVAQASTPDGFYLVGYQTPGTDTFTVVCQCRTPGQAQTEAARLNDAYTATRAAEHQLQARRIQANK